MGNLYNFLVFQNSERETGYVRDCNNARKTKKREIRGRTRGRIHGTRDSTSHKSIREKSRAGQLTRRQVISGSERRIKEAWEMRRTRGRSSTKRKREGVKETGGTESYAVTCYRLASRACITEPY